ncbi:MAG TPA: OmpA family protein [Puia sp.]|uniref:OmpA family protein n=1 Tax=Puia sp. TaxID=2045100 RepID=UPI002CF682FB|nr:OmpA family protein [Puia sp.]HVU97645.1 OmpA family protein [Puia sp.]
MKPIVLIVLLLDMTLAVRSQSVGDVVKQQAGQGVKTGAAVATEQAANNVSNRLLNKLFNKKPKNGKADPKEDPVKDSAKTSPSQDLSTYSKFDFVPGDKILVVEDFNTGAIGDFPDKWNTNSTGEIQGIQGIDGKWLSVTKRGIFLPEFINSLPDNFTLQLDLLCSDNTGYGSGNFGVSFDVIPNASKQFTQLGRGVNRNEVAVWFQPVARGGLSNTRYEAFADDLQTMNNEVEEADWIAGNAQKRLVKLSFWRQRQRLRVYMNEEKVWDIPRAFENGKNYNTVLFRLSDDILQNGHYLFGNIRLAVGEPDTRSKLLTEGRFSTTGILFDVNSASVKGESFGALKDIADVLKENTTLRLNIVGHTDSDGDAAANLSLSQKRAAAVKDALVREFGIDAGRLQTDGKGATQPVAPNTTPTAKAQNRRVEFIKL